MNDYAHPETLVSTQWLEDHLKDPSLRIVEAGVDTTAYDEGHIRGAVAWSWLTQLIDSRQRNILSKDQFEELMMNSGIANRDTVVLYGECYNWLATFAFWEMKIYGHEDVRLLNGGRQKWVAEGRPLVTGLQPRDLAIKYTAKDPDSSLRALLQEVRDVVDSKSMALVDVRGPKEFSGEIIAPPGVTETAQRGGHIPGAVNVTWSRACNPDGTFKSHEELREIYADAGIDGAKPVVTYCRIGERSSHTWFVLRWLLGIESVKNYDGSWTEWGNLVGAPLVSVSGAFQGQGNPFGSPEILKRPSDLTL